jgi:hypothetical protein
MPKRHELLLGFLLATAMWTIFSVLQSDVSAYYQICETNQYTNKESCTPHHIPYVIAWYIGYWFDKASAVLTAFATAAIAAFTFTLWKSNEKMWSITRDSIDIARDDFNATHRPWVPITNAAIGFGLRWSQGTAIIGLNVFCKNTGNSPARRVSLAVAIFPSLANDDIPAEIAKIQSDHRTSTARDLIEHTLFPGTVGELCLSRPLVIPESKIANLTDGFGGPATEMVPVILGSIEYYFSFGEGVPHYTPFVYHLWRVGNEGVVQMTIKLDGSSVEAGDMVLIPIINAGDPT